ncbi:DUF6069 family protein [Georgenia satyanarayanai]|uniref:DUF6069 family protein n=1 Tax=Georgenia satyanarayanai TaxID=860221 RepID=UPI00203D46CE|nr:DUF6069 family protein [Georgenia satyanarayanai]MCM3661349.1 DUF6069 family protein [Georgenia satyanarayanai]
MSSSSTTQTRARRGATVAGAAAAGLAVWIVTVPVLGVEVTARAGEGEMVVGAPAVAAAGVVAALAGWGLLAVLERAGARARTVWTRVALAVLVASLVPPLLQATTVTAGAVLVAMHVAVGATIIAGLGRTARSVSSSERSGALHPQAAR